MIKIPTQSKKHSVSPGSDLLGTIATTKNINLDEAGYIKLSSRAISILSERDDGDVGLPIAIGRSGSIDGTLTLYVQTADKAFTTTIAETDISSTEDSGSPSFTSDSHGRWFLNLWTTSETNDFFTGNGATYTDRGNLTVNKAHPVEVFRNRNTLCIGDGNSVKQFNSSYASLGASFDLTIPSDFEVVKLAYSNNKMGVLTILDPDTTSGTNQQAFFFVWDGTTATAEQGVPIGSDRGVDVVAYKGSFVVLTRAGQLLQWNGGGFTELASFPFYHLNADWGKVQSRDVFGDILQVEGDVIYINFGGAFSAAGARYETHVPTCPAGIWCYDPDIGLYHRYSAAVSQASLLTVTSGNVNTTNNTLTKTAGTIPPTGSPIKYISLLTINQNIGGIYTPKIYYCIKSSDTVFKLATTRENAINNISIDLTTTGSANNYFLALNVVDFGQTQVNRVGAVDFIGGRKQIFDHLIIGADMADYDSSTGSPSDTLCITAPGFENRGYVITPKLTTDEIEDKGQRVYVKYRALKSTDSIRVKVKDTDLSGLPVATPQARSSATNNCTWLGTNSFSTSADLADALTAYTNGADLECEIIAGAGAGDMAQITSITYASGVYSVLLDEDVTGAAVGRYCDIVIDNWTYLGAITSDDIDGFKSFNIGRTSTWFKFKVELRGSDVIVEEIGFTNKVHMPA